MVTARLIPHPPPENKFTMDSEFRTVRPVVFFRDSRGVAGVAIMILILSMEGTASPTRTFSKDNGEAVEINVITSPDSVKQESFTFPTFSAIVAQVRDPGLLKNYG